MIHHNCFVKNRNERFEKISTDWWFNWKKKSKSVISLYFLFIYQKMHPSWSSVSVTLKKKFFFLLPYHFSFINFKICTIFLIALHVFVFDHHLQNAPVMLTFFWSVGGNHSICPPQTFSDYYGCRITVITYYN